MAVKSDNLQSIQYARRLILFAGIAAILSILLVSVSYWPDGSLIHEILEILGLVLIATCIAGRTWASLYIGGRKKTELVMDGPYSIMRNPLYSFTFLGATGAALQFGAVTITVVSVVFAYITFRIVVGREEMFLRDRFGTQYENYLKRVPRFLPLTRLWRSPDIIEVEPRLVWQTFRDALVFLLAIPVFELIDEAHALSILPTFFTFY